MKLCMRARRVRSGVQQDTAPVPKPHPPPCWPDGTAHSKWGGVQQQGGESDYHGVQWRGGEGYSSMMAEVERGGQDVGEGSAVCVATGVCSVGEGSVGEKGVDDVGVVGVSVVGVWCVGECGVDADGMCTSVCDGGVGGGGVGVRVVVGGVGVIVVDMDVGGEGVVGVGVGGADTGIGGVGQSGVGTGSIGELKLGLILVRCGGCWCGCGYVLLYCIMRYSNSIVS